MFCQLLQIPNCINTDGINPPNASVVPVNIPNNEEIEISENDDDIDA